VGRKSDLSECSVYDDLMMGRGQEAPENHPLIVVRGFFYRLVRYIKNARELNGAIERKIRRCN
jgi:hypothetical protein